MSQPTLVFTGGGTGGHVFPMLAVADAACAYMPLRIVVIGTARGLEARLVPERGYELEVLQALPMRGGGLWGAARGAARALSLVSSARALLRRYEARTVFSVGGYVAGSTSLAARTLGIPLALLEPNGEIGLANRLIAPFVQRAYTAFEPVERHFPERAVLRTGVPIRAGFDPRPYILRPPLLRVLVLGGSQGAQALNRTIPQALSRVKAPIRIIHQAGRDNEEQVRVRYSELGMAERATVLAFIEDMPGALSEADLVIGRSGASAVSEICAIGRPSLLIPYPHAGAHQRLNAETLSQAGAALCLRAHEATAERVTTELDRLCERPELLEHMATRARALGKPHAAQHIARDLIGLCGLMQAQTDRTALAREEPREGPLKLNSSRLQPQGRAGEEALRSVRKYASTADEAFEDVAAASLSRLGRVG